MASEQTFSEWYFAYCQQHNHTPGMEEVWNAALAAAPEQQAGAPASSATPQIEAWTWFDERGDYQLSRDEPSEGATVFQLTPLAAAPSIAALPKAAPAQQAGAPTQERPHALGCTVSVDVSTGDDDAGHRIFAKVGSMQQEANGDWTLLAEETSRNFATAGAPLPLAPIDEERGDRVLLTAIRRQQLDEGLDPTCGYVKALDRAIERLATPPQATLPASEAEKGRYSFVCGGGCGVCKVKLAPFEYERTKTLDGDLIGSKCRPQVVSACCGADVHAYDNQTDGWGELVDVKDATRAQPQADAAGESHPLNRRCECTACASSFEQLVTALQLSAPKRIYLDVGEALVGAAPQQFKELEEVTWSEDNATGHGIPYVRADLAAPQADAAEPVAQRASDAQIRKAYELGFLRAAEWVNRVDLRSDLDSGAYAKDSARDLGPMLATQAPSAAKKEGQP